VIFGVRQRSTAVKESASGERRRTLHLVNLILGGALPAALSFAMICLSNTNLQKS
jgi:hypothetical protein